MLKLNRNPKADKYATKYNSFVLNTSWPIRDDKIIKRANKPLMIQFIFKWLCADSSDVSLLRNLGRWGEEGRGEGVRYIELITRSSTEKGYRDREIVKLFVVWRNENFDVICATIHDKQQQMSI